MNGQSINQHANHRHATPFLLPLLTAAAAGLSVGLAVLLVEQPLPLAAIAGAAAAGYFVISRPERATLAVLFVIYSNAAVVAVRFHGVPVIAGAMVPLILLFPLGYFLWIRREKIILPEIVPHLFVFELVRLLSALFAERPEIATKTMLTSVTEGLLLFLLLVNVIRTPEMLRRACWAVLAAGAFLGSISTYQYLTKDYGNQVWGFGQNRNQAAFRVDPDDPASAQPRLEGSIGEQNFYAQMMLMLMPLALFRIFGERRRWLKLAAAAAAVLIGFGVILTFSRGAIVGGGVLLLAMAWLRRISWKQLGLVAACGFGVLLFVPQFQARLRSFESLLPLISSESNRFAETDRSTQGRLTEMAAAGLVFAEHPLLGVGPGMFKHHFTDHADALKTQIHTENRGAHNTYLQIAAESGLAGIGCYLAILVLSMRGLLRVIRTCGDRGLVDLASGLLLALVAFSVTSFFLDYAYIRFLWVILALGWAACWLGSAEKRQSSNALPAPVPQA